MNWLRQFICHGQRLFFAKQSRTGIPLFLSTAPILMISIQLQFQLSGLHLCFLNTKHVASSVEENQKSLSHAGTQAIIIQEITSFFHSFSVLLPFTKLRKRPERCPGLLKNGTEVIIFSLSSLFQAVNKKLLCFGRICTPPCFSHNRTNEGFQGRFFASKITLNRTYILCKHLLGKSFSADCCLSLQDHRRKETLSLLFRYPSFFQKSSLPIPDCICLTRPLHTIHAAATVLQEFPTHLAVSR